MLLYIVHHEVVPPFVLRSLDTFISDCSRHSTITRQDIFLTLTVVKDEAEAAAEVVHDGVLHLGGEYHGRLEERFLIEAKNRI